MAADFNAIFHSDISSSEHVTKIQPTQFLLEMKDFHLIRVDARTRKKTTWYRRINNQMFSRLDLILTNLPVSIPTHLTKTTIFLSCLGSNLRWSDKGKDPFHREGQHARL